MAGVEVGTGYITIEASARGAVRQVQRDFADQMPAVGDKAGKGLSGGFLAAAGKIAAPLAALFAVNEIKNFFVDANAEARESQKVGATTTQIIKATGGAAKITADQVGELTTAISNKTGVDDEAIQKGANLLLTFKNVKNEAGAGADIFDRATQSAVDLSAAGFGSVESASKQLGKALNDPVKGTAALSKAGVTFTDQQKEQIKTLVKSGDTLGAQKIIMKEVESQVGGVAAASATAGEKLSVAFGNFKEQVGTALLPIIDKVETTLTTKVIPAISGFIAGMQDGTGKGGQFVDALKSAGRTLQSVGGFLASNRDIIIPLVGAIGAAVLAFKAVTGVMRAFAVVQGIINVVMSANPIGLVVIGIAALVAGLIYAYRHSETFRAVVQKAFAGVKAAFAAVGNAAKAVFSWLKVQWSKAREILTAPIIAGVRFVQIQMALLRIHFNKILAYVQFGFRTAWAALKQTLTHPIESAKNAIGTILGKTGLQSVFGKAVTAVGKIWDGLKSIAKAPIRFVINTVLNDGLIGAFNKIAGFVGAGKIDRIPLPNGFATGGILPGNSSWRHGDDQIITARRGEGIVMSEVLRDPYERQRFMMANRLAKQGKPLSQLQGFATGGLVGGAGRFSPLFAGVLKLAQKLTGHQLAIYQRGFRPATSYSGTSHQGDAVDARVDNKLLRTLRALGVAIWDRTGKGNWAPHMHGVPLPGRGFAAGSGRWQAQDYLRGGDGLGGRDDGPRVGVGANIAAFIKAGFNSATDWLKSLLKKPLDKLREIGSSPFAQMAARFPSKIADAMLDKVKGYAGGTGSAAPGWASVAEHGPELVTRPSYRMFKGGEKVHTASETAGMGATVNQYFPASATPKAAADAAGGRVVMALSGMGV